MQEYTYIEDHNYINEFIKNLSHPDFKEVRDVTIENIRTLLWFMVDKYEKGDLKHVELSYLIDALEDHFYHKYRLDFPETYNPVFLDEDPRSIGFTVIDYIHTIVEGYIIFPEDCPIFKKFLMTPLGQEKEAYEEFFAYVKQFNFKERIEEANKRGLLEGELIYTS